MNIGERIKERRKELNLSVDDIANKLNKNRATIYRYESNDIENLPIGILEPLAKILQTTPGYLMGWNIKENPNKKDLTKDETKLLANYNKLNDTGKKEANKRVAELTCVPMYSNSEITAIVDNPQKTLEDMYDTIAAHDDDLTPNEKEEMNRRILDKINKLHKGK